MQQLFWDEAARNQILPIHSPNVGRAGLPSLTAGRSQFEYASGMTDIPESAAPPTLRRSFTIEASVVIPAVGARGVLVAHGGQFGGYAFYVHDGKATFHYNALGPRQYRIRSKSALTPGVHRLRARVTPDSPAAGAPANVTVQIDDHLVASGRIDQTLTAWISHTEGFDVGADRLTPVSNEYTSAASHFSGELQKLRVMLE
jgi:hypothetical protein